MSPFLPPQSVEAAITALYDGLNAEDLILLKMTDEEVAERRREDRFFFPPRALLHHSLMMGVRNTWLLWEKESPIVQDAIRRYGVSHGDDVSGLIQEGLLARLDGREVDLAAKAAGYREHWRRQGVDPLTGEKV